MRDEAREGGVVVTARCCGAKHEAPSSGGGEESEAVPAPSEGHGEGVAAGAV